MTTTSAASETRTKYFHCGTCGDTYSFLGDAQKCCHVNEDCPERCSSRHAAPTPDDYGQWFCPETGTVYNRCDACDDWTEGRYYYGAPTLIAGMWVCVPNEHGYCYCDSCEEWQSEDDGSFLNDYGDDWTCYSCQDSRREAMRVEWLPDVLPYVEPVDTRIFRRYNVVQAAASFYLAEWVIAQASRHGRRGDATWRIYEAEARAVQDTIVAEAAPLFATYLDGAIGGELRHHVGVTDALNHDRADSSWRLWPRVRAALGTDALRHAHDSFMDNNVWPDSGYGGETWAQITRVLLEYETGKRTPHQFVDAVFSLQHNGGIVLDKVAWAGHDVNTITVLVGPSHHGQWVEATNTVETDLYWLVKLASDPVRRLALDAVRLHNRTRRMSGDHPIVVGTPLYVPPFFHLDASINLYDEMYGEGKPWPVVYQ